MTEQNIPLVAIKCITFNQESYIRDALEGFVMQQTKFPFVAIVHDDASTDRTADIIREYADKYPDIIRPIFETENQYSKHDGSLTRIMNQAVKATGAHYIAFCEGDDYWIDPLKLQKQVDFMESNLEYSICCTNTIISNRNKLSMSRWNVKRDKDVTIQDVIMNGGYFISTASILCRTEHYSAYESLNKVFHVGDYPLQIFLSSKGKVRILAENMCVYRTGTECSWSNRHNANKMSAGYAKLYLDKELDLLNQINLITNNKYKKIIENRKILCRYNAITPLEGIDNFKLILSHPLLIFQYNSCKHIIYSILPICAKRKIMLKQRY